MKMKLQYFLVCVVVIATVIQEINAQSEIHVNYIVTYSDENCSTAPDPPKTGASGPSGFGGLTVMEKAADHHPQLRFTATYFGTGLGYSIDAINGTFSSPEDICTCCWFLYIRNDGDEFLSPVGVSRVVSGRGSTLIWRYQKDQGFRNHFESVTAAPSMDVYTSAPGTTITVTYVIDYQDQDVCGPGLVAPPPVEVEIPIQGTHTAQQVMEKSVDFGREYRFTATYFNYWRGYSINAINGTSSDISTNCFWLFYVRLPNTDQEILPDVAVSKYVIPTDGYTVTMRYQVAGHDPDNTYTTEEGTPNNQTQPQVLDDTTEEGTPNNQTQPQVLVSILLLATIFATITKA